MPLLAAVVALQAPPPSCLTVFDSAARVIGRDYAGAAAHAAAIGADEQRRVDSLRRVAGRTSGERCGELLEAFLQGFGDPHLVLVRIAAGRANSSPAAPPPAPPRQLQPSLRWLDDSAAVLVLPTFSLRFRGAIDSLLRENLERLTHTARLVVDVRGNGGGCNCSYDLLRDLLYTNPVRIPAEDIWATPGNVEQYRIWRDDPRQADDFRALIRRAWPALVQQANRWVSFAPEQVYRRPRLYRLPSQVGILFDR